MVEIWLPYGNTEVPIRIPDENLLGEIKPKERQGAPDPKSEIIRALENPIGTKRLRELAKPGSKVAIVVEDVTRPAPSHLMLPPILDELNQAGVKDEDVTVVFGCGTHRAVKPEEMPKLIGEDALKRVKAINHDCNAPDLVFVGETSFKTKVYVNKVFAEADVRVLTGDIELHYYAGYGGGRKGVLPAVSGAETIQHNHALLLDPKSATGNLEGNPVHADMLEGARLAKTDFILNVVMNSNKEIVNAFAGDVEKAFLEGVKLVDEMHKIPVEDTAEIVITSADGAPHDVNLFQSLKAVENAINIVKEDGVIVLIAECREGHGNQLFYDWMAKFKDLGQLEKEIKRKFVLGGHKAYYLQRALKKAKIILVSTLPDYYATGIFKLKTAKTANEALRMAFNIAGKKSKIWIMPHGSTTLPVITGS